MKPAPFAYARPDTVADALQLLASAAGEAKVLAGGQSLVPLLNLRMARPDVLVDIGRLVELDRIVFGDDALTIGALTRHARIELAPEVRQQQPLLAAAAAHIGHRAIRNHGTVAGSIAHADPAAELPAVLLATEGHVIADSVAGRRSIPADELFAGYYQTTLADNELLTWVVVPAIHDGTGWGFCEFAVRSGDFAQAGAVALARAMHGTVSSARLVLFAVADTPVAIDLGAVVGGTPDDAIAVAGERVDAWVAEHAVDTTRSTLIGEVARRALTDALRRTRLTPEVSR